MNFFFTVLVLILVGCSGNQPAQQSKNLPDSVTSEMHKPRFDSVITREYYYTNLSGEFNIKVFFKNFLDSNQFTDSSVVRLVLVDKKGESAFDTVGVQSTFSYTGYFRDSMTASSYSTRINMDREIVDNDFGELIIADLNFDGLDDIAMISDIGGNSGPLYTFFVQNVQKEFQTDRFLTDSMSFFPTEINKQQRTLLVRVRAGAAGVGEHVYYLKGTGHKWVQKSHIIVSD